MDHSSKDGILELGVGIDKAHKRGAIFIQSQASHPLNQCHGYLHTAIKAGLRENEALGKI